MLLYSIIIDDIIEELFFRKTVGEWDNWNEESRQINKDRNLFENIHTDSF